MSRPYQALARQYRPQCFADVLGQDPIVTTLKNALKYERVSHAYLFSGLRGTGKTTLARLFAKALNCPHKDPLTQEPCSVCPSCKDIAAGNALDVLECDGASNRGIDDIRKITDTLPFAPTHGRFKIYILDEVHMLTKEAFNALLKTLEEPPAHVKFFFATTEPHKIPATILSRCQRFQLARLTPTLIAQKLAAIISDLQASATPAALATLARMSEGSLRDAESLLDQALSLEGNVLTTEGVAKAVGLCPQTLFFQLDQAGAAGDMSAAFSIADAIFASGHHLGHVLEQLTDHFRILLRLRYAQSPPTDYPTEYTQSQTLYREEQLLHILEFLTEAQQEFKSAISEKTFIEMLLLRILKTHKKIFLDQILKKIEQLAKTAPPAPTPVPTLSAPPLPKTSPPPAPLLKTPPPPSAPPPVPPTVSQQSRFDTIMRFAAKELNSTLQVSPRPGNLST